MKRLAFALVVLALAGCSERAAEPPPAAPAEGPTGGVIEAVSGRAQIDAGRKAAAKVREVGAQKQSDLDAVQQP